MSIFSDLRHVMEDKRVEPLKRKKGSTVPEWIVHRFPIQGGISLREAWIKDMFRPNPLLRRLMAK